MGTLGSNAWTQNAHYLWIQIKFSSSRNLTRFFHVTTGRGLVKQASTCKPQLLAHLFISHWSNKSHDWLSAVPKGYGYQEVWLQGRRICSLSHYSFSWPEFSSVQFIRSVVSDSLRPHEPQHTRPPCPSPTPGVHPNPCPSSRWCHPDISSSLIPFSSCPQSLLASGLLLIAWNTPAIAREGLPVLTTAFLFSRLCNHSRKLHALWTMGSI